MRKTLRFINKVMLTLGLFILVAFGIMFAASFAGVGILWLNIIVSFGLPLFVQLLPVALITSLLSIVLEFKYNKSPRDIIYQPALYVLILAIALILLALFFMAVITMAV